MARYIDADVLIEVLQELRDTSSLNDGAGNPVDSILYDVIRRIEDSPTADVAPREEVDRLRFNLKAVLDERAVDMAEVAIRVFEELNRYIVTHFCLSNDDVDEIRKKIDKLEKKYTEDNQ